MILKTLLLDHALIELLAQKQRQCFHAADMFWHQHGSAN